MRKLFKIRNLLAASMAVVMCLSFAGCSGKGGDGGADAGVAVKEDAPKGEKITLYQDTYEGKDLKVSADFYYPENEGIEVLEQQAQLVRLKWEEKNLTIQLTLQEEEGIYDRNKESDMEAEGYEEFKIKDYDSYGLPNVNGFDYLTVIHLEKASETTDRYVEVTTKLLKNTDDAPKGKAQIDIPEVKAILESLKYNGVVDAPATIIDAWATETEPKTGYVFWTDGTGRYTYDGGYSMFTYTDNGDSVSITLNGEETAKEYAYRIEKGKLFLTDADGNELTFVRE